MSKRIEEILGEQLPWQVHAVAWKGAKASEVGAVANRCCGGSMRWRRLGSGEMELQSTKDASRMRCTTTAITYTSGNAWKMLLAMLARLAWRRLGRAQATHGEVGR